MKQVEIIRKKMYSESYKEFKKFMSANGYWYRFVWLIFIYYGRMSHANMVAEDNTFPPYYINDYPLLINDKKVDWIQVNVKWQTCYYKLEEKI